MLNESIRAIEEHIEELRDEAAIIQLKRARNSLLYVSRLPSEILGDIFCRNVAIEGLFGGLEERSYNFLLVCHHWFDVASHTPEVWSSWGNSLQDWRKRHIRYPMAPLDLVLEQRPEEGLSLDESLRNALQDRAARGNVRRIHLLALDSEIIHSILSSLAGSEELRYSSVQSIVVQDKSEKTLINIPNLFSCRFPRLQHLKLEGCVILLWDHIIPQTSTLTTLSLNLIYPTPLPTMSQLLSFLGSNPALQEISLLGCTVPDGGGDMSSVPVPLRHLRDFELEGSPRQVFGLLYQLDLPGDMDRFAMHLSYCTLKDIPETIGPYLRDCLQRREMSQRGLGLYLSSSRGFIELRVSDVCSDFSASELVQMEKFMVITIGLEQVPLNGPSKQQVLDLIPHTFREEIVYFRVNGDPVVMVDLSAQLPCLRTLHIEWTFIHLAFPEPTPGTDVEIYPSLQHLVLGPVVGNDWRPLMTFLARRASYGNQLDTVVTSALYYPLLDDEEDIKEDIKKAVGEFGVLNIPPFQPAFRNSQ